MQKKQNNTLTEKECSEFYDPLCQYQLYHEISDNEFFEQLTNVGFNLEGKP